MCQIERMSKCGICGSRTENLSICKACGIHFCKKHGDSKKKLCDDCNEFRQDSIADKTPEDDIAGEEEPEEEEEFESESDGMDED